jgi:drug/metabolite transporter (DMT)-like permease
LTINGATLTAGLNQRQRFSPGLWGMEGSFALAGILLIPGKKLRPSWLRRNPIGFILGVMLLGMAVSLSSCGGGGSSNNGQGQVTPKSGTVTVTATSGTLTHTAQVAVTIN